jgi:hypothetical protein
MNSAENSAMDKEANFILKANAADQHHFVATRDSPRAGRSVLHERERLSPDDRFSGTLLRSDKVECILSVDQVFASAVPVVRIGAYIGARFWVHLFAEP